MDEYTADAFANRDEPVPLLAIPNSDIDASASEAESTSSRLRLKKSLSPSRLKEKAAGLADNVDNSSRTSLQDRLFSRLLQQVMPTEDVDDEGEPQIDRRSSKYVQRPAFSLPLMTNNFRRFNARIGIVFVFQNRVIRLFTWRKPTQTLSFLATYTFVCLDPYLLSVLPLAVTLLFVMVPAFVSRHPPPPPQSHTSSTTPYYSTYTGPALAPARTIKPAAETSKDFFRNMRDLQNSMADFSAAHDALVSFIAPATNFSDEILSSTIFLYLTFLALALFVTAGLLPWRLILLIIGWAMIISSHPTIQNWLVKQQRRAFAPSAPTKLPTKSSKDAVTVFGLTLPPIPATLHPLITSISTITLSSQPQTREVEIFELQQRPLISSTGEWQPFLFTPTPYDPLSPSRIAGDRPKGTRFFEDVQPPRGWEWASKKWELDLDAGEWVSERLVVGVEYDVVNVDEDREGESSEEALRRGSVNGEFGGWVWDLPPQPGQADLKREEEMWLAYGDYDFPKPEKGEEKAGKGKGHKKGVESRDWEEAVRYGSRGKTGEWRRRRWVRVVKRTELREHGV